MLHLTNPILKEIKDADGLLIKLYRKIAKALKKKGDLQGYRKYIKKMFEEINHRKTIQQEIELNEREASVSTNEGKT